MSQTTAPTTARPRPRPKAKPKPAAPKDGSQPSSSSISLKEEDKLFMRNLSPVVQTKPKAEKKQRKVSNERQTTASPSKAGDWKSQKNFSRFMSVELSEDEDDDDDALQIIENDSSNGRRKRKWPDDSKRQRSRSRSLTPPPAVPQHQLQNARAVIQKALGAGFRRSESPSFDDEGSSIETVVLDPELELVAQRIRAQAKFPDRQSSAVPEEEKVILNVKWKHHPLTTDVPGAIMSFRLDRHDNFRDLFEAVAEEVSVFSESIIMSYNGQRFFPSVTPQTLQIWGEANIIAYDEPTYEYITKQAAERKKALNVAHTHKSDDEIEILSDDDSEAHEPEDASVEASQTTNQDGASDANASESEDDTFKILVRSAASKDITLTVRPTTKCGAIVRAYLKKSGLADQYPEIMSASGSASPRKKRKGNTTTTKSTPQLCVDGDRIADHTEIGSQDLEDGDLVEVVGIN